MVRRYHSVLPLWLILGLVLTACGVAVDIDQHVTLKEGEKWDAIMLLGISSQNLALIGGEAVVNQEIEENLAVFRNQGVDAKWSSRIEGERHIYNLELSGRGYDQLSQLVFGGQATFTAIEMSGETRVSFSLPTLATVNLGQYSLSLEGKRVLSTNGDQSDQIAEWKNPPQSLNALQAEIVPKPDLNILGLTLILLGAVLLLSAIWLALRKSQPIPKPASMTSFCPYCGKKVLSGARFCGNCGRSVSEK